MAFRVSSFNINQMQGKNYQPAFNASNLRFVPINPTLGNGMLYITNDQVETTTNITNNSLNLTTAQDSTLEFNVNNDNRFVLNMRDAIGTVQNEITVTDNEMSIKANGIKLEIGGDPLRIVGSGLRITGGSTNLSASSGISKNHYLYYCEPKSGGGSYTLTLPELETDDDNGIVFLLLNLSGENLYIQTYNNSDTPQPIYSGGGAVSSLTILNNRSIQLTGIRETTSPNAARWIYQLYS